MPGAFGALFGMEPALVLFIVIAFLAPQLFIVISFLAFEWLALRLELRALTLWAGPFRAGRVPNTLGSQKRSRRARPSRSFCWLSSTH